MEVSVRTRKLLERNGGMQTIWWSYTIKVVDTCTSGKVNDQPRSVVVFTFVGD